MHHSNAFVFVAVALATTATASESSTPMRQDPAVTDVIVRVPSTTVEMPDRVQATATVTPSNIGQSVTWASSDPSIATVDATGRILPLLQGTVTITATSTVDPTASGSVTLSIACPGPRLVTSNVDGDTTWENWLPDPACYDYRVQTFVRMIDEVLTIEPGTRIGFDAEEWLRVVDDDGALVAVGTAEEPIVLTAFEATTPGYWRGIQLQNAASPLNRLDHVIVEYGGFGDIAQLPGANIEMNRDSRLSLSNSTLRHSSGFGLYVDRRNSRIEDFAGNVLTANASNPAYVSARQVDGLLAGNQFDGNGIDEIRVETGTNNDLEEADAVWRDHGVPYHLQHRNGALWHVRGVTLTLEPGVDLLIGDETGISIAEGAHLVAVGTAEDRITLDAWNERWRGVRFVDGTGTLDHVSVVNAGSEQMGANAFAALSILTADENPPLSEVELGSDVILSGLEYDIAFGHHDTYVTGCRGTTFVQTGDDEGEHCRIP